MNLESMNDGQLLELFSTHNDERAFELLAARHAEMVANVAKRVLPNANDVDDVTQAVFVVLARKAATLKAPDTIAGWLHHVTVNVATRARDAGRLRQMREREARAMTEPTSQADIRSAADALRPVLDAHLEQLPEKYRKALIVHHLEGRSVEDAAQKLAVPVGTLASWLCRGRELLRERLTRGGFTFSAGLLGSALSHETLSEKLSSEVISRMAQTAARAAANPATANISPQAVALSEGELNAMSLKNYTWAALLLLCLLLAGTGGALAAFRETPAVANAPVITNPAPVPQAVPAARLPQTPVVETRDDKKPEPPKVDPEIAACIQQLGDEDLKVRVIAVNKLKAAGEKASAALQAATRSADIDISSRATLILAVQKNQPLVDKIKAAPGNFKTLSYALAAKSNFEFDIADAGLELCGTWRGYTDNSESELISDITVKAANRMIKTTSRHIRNQQYEWSDIEWINDRDIRTRSIYKSRPSEDASVLNASTLCARFDFTTIVEKEINGETLHELSGVLREDFLSPEEHADILSSEGASFIDNLKTMKKIVLRVAKKDLLLRSGEVLDEADKILASIVITDLKINPVFAENAFDYTPPEGVKVIDMTEKLPAGNAAGKK
jgi:RNA polymerase sigma factor (sigma-70 family)